MKQITLTIATLFCFAACNSPENATDASPETTQSVSTVEVSEIAANDLPSSVLTLVTNMREGFTIVEVQKKIRDGRTYYDVEGTLPDGSEIEFDVLMTEDGPKIVEIQRDLDWADVPAEVQTLAMATTKNGQPVRIIESEQAEDGSIVYEFFVDGQPNEPAFEIMSDDGLLVVLDERSRH